jgi:P27 family predicted phage terminase small subunit
MGERGPKPLPANVHLLNGNPSKKKFSVLSDGSRVPVEIPDCPSHLDAGAKREWKLIVPELERLGLIAKIDKAALAIYCVAYSRWEAAEKELKKLGLDALTFKTPSGYTQTSPLLQISNKAQEQIKSSMADFGMSPSARSRVSVTLQGDLFGNETTGTTKNPAAVYFGNKRPG